MTQSYLSREIRCVWNFKILVTKSFFFLVKIFVLNSAINYFTLVKIIFFVGFCFLARFVVLNLVWTQGWIQNSEHVILGGEMKKCSKLSIIFLDFLLLFSQIWYKNLIFSFWEVKFPPPSATLWNSVQPELSWKVMNNLKIMEYVGFLCKI